MGLAALGEVPSRHVDVEGVEQGEVRFEPDAAEQPARVLRRGGGSEGYPGAAYRPDEAQRVGKGVDPDGLEQLVHPPLLAPAVLLDAVLVLGELEMAQRGAGAAEGGLAGHPVAVEVGREPIGGVRGPVAEVAPARVHQMVERLAPGPLVGRVDEHAVHVEHRPLEARCRRHSLQLLAHRGGRGAAHGAETSRSGSSAQEWEVCAPGRANFPRNGVGSVIGRLFMRSTLSRPRLAG